MLSILASLIVVLAFFGGLIVVPAMLAYGMWQASKF